jgi:hypothetical protein
VSLTPLPPTRSEVIQSTTSHATPKRESIPAARVARIRAWVKYGITVPQVAAIYGVEVDEIVRLLGKA